MESKFISSNQYSPVIIDLTFDYDISGFKQETMGCLKRVCALGVYEYFFNREVSSHIKWFITSCIFEASKIDKANVVVINRKNSILRGKCKVRMMILESHIRTSTLQKLSSSNFHHEIPLFSADHCLLMIQYQMRFHMRGFSHAELPGLIERGYHALDLGNDPSSCKMTCERTHESLKDIYVWRFDEVLNRMKWSLSISSPLDKVENRLLHTPLQIEEPSAPTYEQENKRSLPQRMLGILWKK